MIDKVYFVAPGDLDLTMTQVQEWQLHLDKLVSDNDLPWKIFVLPPGSEVTEADCAVWLNGPGSPLDLDACAE